MELTLDRQALWRKSPLPRRMDLPSSRAAFLNLGIIDIWGKIILCRGVLVSMRHTWWAAWLAWSKLLLQGPHFKNFRCVCTCVLSSRFFWINLHPHIVISFSVFPPLSCSSCSPDRLLSWPLLSVHYWRIWGWCAAAHRHLPSQLQALSGIIS